MAAQYDPERVDVILAYMRGEIRALVASKVLGISRTNLWAHGMGILRAAMDARKLKIEHDA